MRICGLITEYNPFHNGHIHHLEEARKQCNADYLIVVMSGNFVQRGAPAIIDKYCRTKMALLGGADAVFELPSLFATSSAEVFARAAVSLLEMMGCVDTLCFGAEDADIEVMKVIAKTLNHEPESVSEDIQDYLKSGMTYPAARAEALEHYLSGSISNVHEILAKPNNILGIEYLRALDRLHSKIEPVAIKRWHTDYHSVQVYQDTASATAIRNMINHEDTIEKIVPYVPADTAREFALKMNVSTPVRSNDFSSLLSYRILSEREHLNEYLGFSPDLKERVENILPLNNTFNEWVDALNAKNYTYAGIHRALLHLILNMKKDDLKEFEADDYCLYARLLGFRQDKKAVLTQISKNSPLPLISKMADAKKNLSEKAYRLLQFDIFSSDVYRSVVYQKFNTELKDEFTQKIIKV